MDSQNNSPKLDIYQLVTDQVIELLSQGIVPWQKPWKDSGMPTNLLSKRAYRGINLWLLNTLPYETNYFLTFEQIKALGGSVLKGEKGHMVVFWKPAQKKAEEQTEETKRQVPLLRYYKVFNLAQTTGIPADLIPALPSGDAEVNPILECETVLALVPDMPAITFSGKAAAYYNIEKDEITMPKMKNFRTSPSYYCTVFHELVHATGAERRLNRKTITDRVPFGSESYAMEELVAEMGAAFLCRYTGILVSEIANSVAYIDNWLEVLKKDKRFIIAASGQAQKAVDYLLNRQADQTKDEPNGVVEESVVS